MVCIPSNSDRGQFSKTYWFKQWVFFGNRKVFNVLPAVTHDETADRGFTQFIDFYV